MLHSCPRFPNVLWGRSSQGGDSRREGRLLKQQDWGGRRPPGPPLFLEPGPLCGATLHRTARSPLKCYPQPCVPTPRCPRPQRRTTPPLSQAIGVPLLGDELITVHSPKAGDFLCKSIAERATPEGITERGSRKGSASVATCRRTSSPHCSLSLDPCPFCHLPPSRHCTPFPSKEDELQAALRDMRCLTEGRPRDTHLPALFKLSLSPNSAWRKPILCPSL